MTPLRVGDLAPDFTLPATESGTVTLSHLRGLNVVLNFYPKDETPGCTQEACDFRDRCSGFAELNTVILGVSTDPLQSHERFVLRYGLPFTLLSDDREVSKMYGTWVEKERDGQKSMGIERSTFVIDTAGVIRRIDRNVKVEGHVPKVLAFVRLDLPTEPESPDLSPRRLGQRG